MSDVKHPERINLIITFTKRGWSDRVISHMRELGITYNMAGVGYSGVGHDIADYMGLTESACDVIYSVVPDSKKMLALSTLEYRFTLNEKDHGYAICIPISGVGGPISLKYISGIDYASRPEEDEEEGSDAAAHGEV